MKLTDRAKAYLETLDRDPDWVTEPEETRNYLNGLKIPYTDDFLQVQLDLSGYVLTEGNQDSGISPCRIRLISKEQVRKHKKIRMEYFGDKIMTDFVTGDYYGGEWYYVTTDGQLCFKDHESGETILLFESANALVEFAALRSAYAYFTKVDQAGRDEIRNIEAFVKAMGSFEEFGFVPECSGTRDYIWMNDRAMIYVYFWDDPDWFVMEVSGVDPQYCLDFVKKLDAMGVTS